VSGARWLAALWIGIARAGPALAAGSPPGPAGLPPSPFLLRHAQHRTPPFLDAAPPCLPAADGLALEALAARLRARDAKGAERALERVHEGAAAAHADDLRLVDAIVAARAAVGSERSATLRRLERALLAHPHAAARACARLERMRLLLELGREAEARVERARLRREHGEALESLPGRWLRAELAHATGDAEEAGALYEALATSDDARVAQAAALRRLEQRFPVGGRGADAAAVRAWQRLPERLKAAAALGLDVEPFALVAGELALRVDDFGAAHHWLARAERVWPGGLAAIRKADALRALGQPADARRTLERVVRTADAADVRALAELRGVDDRLAEGRRDAALETLAAVARSPHPVLRALARERLAAEGLAAHELDRALAAAVRLTYDAAPQGLGAALAPALAGVIAAAVEERDCPQLLARFGGRRPLLARHSPGPEALLSLGDCLLGLGLAAPALESYRAAGRAFGFERTPDLALRIAEASLAHGDVEAVAAALAAETGPRRPDDPAAARWSLLAAKLALRLGRREEAAAALVALLADARLAPALRPDAELALAELALAGVAPEEAADALRASLSIEAPGDAKLRAHVWLALADLARARGARAAAERAYRAASAALAPGPARDRALYRASEQAALAGEEPGSAWARLARLERRLQRIDDGAHAP
jgi:hypothetical protein